MSVVFLYKYFLLVYWNFIYWTTLHVLNLEILKKNNQSVEEKAIFSFIFTDCILGV